MRMSQELTKHSVWFHRNMGCRDDGGDVDSRCPVTKESKRRLNLLVAELKVPDYTIL